MKGMGRYIKSDWGFLIDAASEYGELAVQFFFVLSGFLVTFLLLKEQENWGRISVMKFYFRRVLRIWPLFFIVLFIAILIAPDYGAAKVENWWLYPSFLSNFDRLSLSESNLMANITWSVAIEEQFYLFWPLIFLLKKPKHLLGLLCSLILISILFQLLYQADGAYFHTLTNLLFLASGGILGLIISQYQVPITRYVNQLTSKQLLLFILLCCAFVVAHPYLFRNWVLLTNVFSALIFALVILSQTLGNKYQLSRFTSLTKVGKYTYGIYLLHPIVLFFLPMTIIPKCLLWFRLKMGLSHDIGMALGFLSVLFFTLVMAMVSYHMIEKPMLKLKGKFYPKQMFTSAQVCA